MSGGRMFRGTMGGFTGWCAADFLPEAKRLPTAGGAMSQMDGEPISEREISHAHEQNQCH
jgi:hypothetical protein